MPTLSFEEFLDAQRRRVVRTLSKVQARINKRDRSQYDIDVKRKAGSTIGGHTGRRLPSLS